MEQRNGRIDRKLQTQTRSTATTSSTSSDRRIASSLFWSARRRRSRRNSAACPRSSTPGLADALKLGIRRDRIDALEHDIESADLDAEKRQTVEDELEAARERQDDLRKQIDLLRTRLDESQKAVGLDEAHFRSPFRVPWNSWGRSR